MDVLLFTRLLLGIPTVLLFFKVYQRSKHLGYIFLALQGFLNIALRAWLVLTGDVVPDNYYNIMLIMANMSALIAAYQIYNSGSMKGVDK